MTLARPTPLIEEVSATGEEIDQIVAEMEPVLIGYPRAHACIACLALAVSMMAPDIDGDDLMEGVKGASQWICLYLSEKSATMGDSKLTLN